MAEEQWSCAFEARSGGRASATFDSREQAREFASRHAQITASDGEWTAEAGGVWLLRTPTGMYRINPATRAHAD
jgi:hypothetical protein